MHVKIHQKKQEARRKFFRPSALLSKKIAIIGFGSQGQAQALNLKDSGCEVVVALRKGSPKRAIAKKAGFKVMDIAAATKVCDILVMLISDMAQRQVYQQEIAPYLKPDTALIFAHGLNIHFKLINPPPGIDVLMVAPMGPGPLVRSLYKAKGVPMLYAIHQNDSGKAEKLAQEYAYALGCRKTTLMQTTFKEETETDLFGEQAVLCGGVTRLIQAGFETLVAAGYKPEIAYFECLHQLKLTVDLIHERGLEGMREAISETARWGDYSVGDTIVNKGSRKGMKKALKNIQSGKFVKGWLKEYDSGLKNFYNFHKKSSEHHIEQVGQKLRKMMSKP